MLSSEGREIDICMEEIGADRAAAVRSAYVEGLSYRELADRHGLPLNTMRTKLRECLER